MCVDGGTLTFTWGGESSRAHFLPTIFSPKNSFLERILVVGMSMICCTHYSACTGSPAHALCYIGRLVQLVMLLVLSCPLTSSDLLTVETAADFYQTMSLLSAHLKKGKIVSTKEFMEVSDEGELTPCRLCSHVVYWYMFYCNSVPFPSWLGLSPTRLSHMHFSPFLMNAPRSHTQYICIYLSSHSLGHASVPPLLHSVMLHFMWPLATIPFFLHVLFHMHSPHMCAHSLLLPMPLSHTHSAPSPTAAVSVHRRGG